MKKTIITTVEKEIVTVTFDEHEFIECVATMVATIIAKIDPPEKVFDAFANLFGKEIAKMTCILFDTENSDNNKEE